MNDNFVVVCNEFFNQLSIINNYQGNLLTLFSAKFIHVFTSCIKTIKVQYTWKVSSLNAIHH